MSDLPMRGPKALRHHLAAWVEADIKMRFPHLRELWGLDEQSLPLPARIDPHEPGTLDVFPVVSVVTSRHTVRPAIDISEAGGAQWQVTYPVRIFAWVRAEGVGPTQDLRDDYLTALQIAVLSRRSFGGFGGGNLALLVDPTRDAVTVDFSGVEAVKGDRHIAGGYLGFSVRATETLGSEVAHPESPQGLTVASVNVQGAVLPTRPALYPRSPR